MKLLVTGAAGLFGRGLLQVFGEQHTVVGITRQDGDITDEKRMLELLHQHKPEIVVHSAAMPDIDDCELNPEKAYRVNAEATSNLVEAAKAIGAAFAQVSTDAVFDGTKLKPYVETDPVNPPSVYGRTKVEAEEAVRKLRCHWIFRVSVLFGPGKANFVNKGLCKLMGKERYEVASDQLGSATYTVDAARTMLDLFQSRKYGTFHLCNRGACTRYDLALRAAELSKLDAAGIIGKPMEEMRRPGPRLKYSVMDMKALRDAGAEEPRSWEDALDNYIGSLKMPLQ
jgi:dTDP-4-dehydrorhamnose reductase